MLSDDDAHDRINFQLPSAVKCCSVHPHFWLAVAQPEIALASLIDNDIQSGCFWAMLIALVGVSLSSYEA